MAVAHVRDMGNALAALAGLKGVRGGAWFRGGLVGVAKHAGERVLRGFQGYGPSKLAPKRQRGVGGRLQRLESSGETAQGGRRREPAVAHGGAR